MTSTAQRRGCSMRWPPATMRKSRRRQTTSPVFNVGPDASASGRTRSGSGLVDAPGRFVAGRGPAGLQARPPRSAPYQVNQWLHQTGALAVYGFRESVDWLPSAAFEMLVIGCLQEVSFTRPGMRKLERDLKDSAPGLFRKLDFRISVNKGYRGRDRQWGAARQRPLDEWEQAGGPACEVLDVICFGAAGYRSSAGARFGRHADGFREALQSAGLDPGGADGPRSTRARAAIRGWNRASPPCRHEHADTRHHAELTLTQGAVQPSHGVRRAQMGERRWNKSCSNSSSPPSSGSTIN